MRFTRPLLLAALLGAFPLALGCSSGGTSGGAYDECVALSQCCGSLDVAEQQTCSDSWQQAQGAQDRVAACNAALQGYVAQGACAAASTGGAGGLGGTGSGGVAGQVSTGGMAGVATGGTSSGGAGGATGGAGGSTGGAGGATGGTGGGSGGFGGSTGGTGGFGGSTGGTGGVGGSTGGSGGIGGSTGGTGGSGGSGGTTGGTPKLFFSEYVEGSSNNKALEIYNAGSSSVDLSTCGLNRYSNGGTTGYAVKIASQGGFLAAGDVWVICHSSISTPSLCDELTSTINHNGNDTWEIVCNGVTQDVFGQVGYDPGTSWDAGGISTVDQTLRRKCSVTSGDTNGTNSFDPSVEWTSAGLDALSDLGSFCGN